MHLRFCMSSSLVTMPLKQLPISTGHLIKDPLVIREYSARFRSSVKRIRNLNIKRGNNIHLELKTNIWKRLLTWIEISHAIGAFQKYRIITKIFSRWRNPINGLQMNSVKIKELNVLKCVRCCIVWNRTMYFLIEYWLMRENESFMIIINVTVWCSVIDVVHCGLMEWNQSLTTEVLFPQMDELNIQLSKMRSALVNPRGLILLHDYARSHVVRMKLQNLTDLEYETFFYLLYYYISPTNNYFSQDSWHFHAQKNSLPKLHLKIFVNKSSELYHTSIMNRYQKYIVVQGL